MADTTTIRVHKETRDLLRSVAEDDHLTFDALIREALEARRWRQYRRQADRDAARLAGDPREREWAARVAAEMDEMAANEPRRERTA
ncbi:hypothetical protein [Kineococcus sp. SYSU DK004]|uniref:hypothetical protein n=1 Tax=Kineococcus sp. SYSU DK004 TaxID=3383125 RepID=UPI003D7D7B03